MSIIKNLFLSLLLIVVFQNSLFARVFTTQGDGNWHNINTWGILSLAELPEIGDTVIIDGHDIDITTADVTVQRLEMINSGKGADGSDLNINGDLKLTIKGDLVTTMGNVAQRILIQSLSTSKVNIEGNLYMYRTTDNNASNKMLLKIYGDSEFLVAGNFIFEYGSSFFIEPSDELNVHGSAIFKVMNDVVFRTYQGYGFSALIEESGTADFGSLTIEKKGNAATSYVKTTGKDASIIIQNDLTLFSKGGTSNYFQVADSSYTLVKGNVIIEADGVTDQAQIYIDDPTSTLEIEGNLTMTASGAGGVFIDMISSSILRLGKDIIRTNHFGAISMESDSKFILDGKNSQRIPRSKMEVAEGDSLNITNLIINNTSSEGLTLSGDFIITEHLYLDSGIIHSSLDSMLIIDDGATIDKGSKLAYVEGPMMKRGGTNGKSFQFPLGSNNIYAPIEIEPISKAFTEYTAQFLGCPPPTGLGVADSLKHVGDMGYWTLSRSDGDQVGNVTLHWDDPEIVGITDTSSLVVSYLSSAAIWHSLGRSDSNGNILTNSSGSIKNDLGCPPPTGVNTFAFGSTDLAENVLPIELNNFRVFKNNENTKVFLEWETISEENSDYFIVEKSNDGIYFQKLDQVQAAQNSTSRQFYSTIDNDPNKGNNYYRIVQMDLDGIMSFSDLKNIFIKNKKEIPSIIPNPVKDYLKLHSDSFKNEEEIPILIFDIAGKCIYRNVHQVQDEQLFLSISNLNIKNPGAYFISYSHNGNTYTLEFIKNPN